MSNYYTCKIFSLSALKDPSFRRHLSIKTRDTQYNRTQYGFAKCCK